MNFLILDFAKLVWTKLSHSWLGVAVLLVLISTTSPVLSFVERGTNWLFTLAPETESPMLVWIL